MVQEVEAEEHIIISGLYSPNFLVRSSQSLDNIRMHLNAGRVVYHMVQYLVLPTHTTEPSSK